MSRQRIPPALRLLVQLRALDRCEYCLSPAQASYFPHEPDHIIAEQHGGATSPENLAFSCFDCNRWKGPNIASVDPPTGVIVELFHPRLDSWREHFAVAGLQITTKTPKGRATAALLRFNGEPRLALRAALGSEWHGSASFA